MSFTKFLDIAQEDNEAISGVVSVSGTDPGSHCFLEGECFKISWCFPSRVSRAQGILSGVRARTASMGNPVDCILKGPVEEGDGWLDPWGGARGEPRGAYLEVGTTAGRCISHYTAVWPDWLLGQRSPRLHTHFQVLELMEDCRRHLSSENGVSHPCPDQAQPCLAAKMEHIRDSRAVDEDGLSNHPHGWLFIVAVCLGGRQSQ